MSSIRLVRAGLATLALTTSCFNPDAGVDTDAGSGDTSGTGSASATVTASASDPTPGSQSASEPTATDASATEATDPSDTDPSDTDPTDTDPSDTDGTTGDIPIACGDGIPVPGEFCPIEPPVFVELGTTAVDVVLADLDDDGAADIAVLSRGSNTVHLAMNGGDGVFAPGLVLDASPGSCGLIAADAEGDGDVDLAVAGNTLVSLVNDGAGGFTRYDSDNSSFGCAEHNNIDVLNNNGGPLDVVYSGAYNNSYAPGFTQNGSWQFAPSLDIDNAGEGSSGVTVTEFAFDADNHPDVVVLNQYFTTASLWAGDGMGGFTGLGTVAACAGLDGASGARFAATGDLDGDGAIDLVISCMQGNFVLVRGTGDATFQAPSEVLLAGAHEPALADVDGDDDLDIVISSTTQQAVYVYINEGAEESVVFELALPGEPRGIAVGDLDGDGVPEIVAAVIGAGTSGLAIVHTDP